MPIVISGTNGISGVDGTASNPSYEGTDANTGVFFPAADTVAIGTNGTEALRVNSSQNVGIGVSPSYKLDVSAGSSGSGVVNTFRLQNVGTTVGDGAKILFTAGTSTDGAGIASTGVALNSADLRFYTGGNTERARITSDGNLLVGATSGTARLHVSQSIADHNVRMLNTASSGAVYGPLVSFTGQAPNNTTSIFFVCADSSATRAEIRSNGGLANFSANNVNLSDERLKTDIQPAGSYLSKICAIPVKTFLYKDQSDSEPNLGVIAQDVEAVAPELVDASGFGETPEDGVPYKTIYQTDLQYALMKCIQEQQQMIETLQAKVAALEAK